jgi:hypothetical protein
MIKTSVFVVAAILSVSGALAAADGVRLTAAAGVVQMRIEVVSASGTTLYDSEWKSGNVLDSTMPVLPYGSYGLRISTRDLEGRLAEKQSTLRVAPDGMSIDPAAASDLKITATLHDGETGQLVTTSGDLSFRFGDYLNRKDTEAMRLSPEGNLDVKGWIRPGQGIVFADGSVLSSATAASIMRTRASRPPEESADAKLHPKSDVTGTGTPNQVTKWIDTGGTLGDSAISEVSGAVKIGTNTAQGQLQIAGAANQDIFSGMGPNIVSGPAMNYGYAGQSFGVGAGFFNVRPASGATGVNPSLRFMTINQERMIVTNTGDVGIATTAPAARLHVVGSPGTSSLYDIGGNAPDVMRIIGGNGGNGRGRGGDGGGVLIQGGNTGDGDNLGLGGAIRLEPGIPYGKVVMAAANNTGVAIGDPTFWTPIYFKLQVNGDVLLGNPNPLSSLPTPRLQVVTPNARGLRVETGTSGDKVASFGALGRFEIDAPNVGGGRLEVTEAGSVGIGTNGPTEKLHVSGGKVRWSNSLLTEDQGGAIELGGTDTIAGGAAATPYIDFHGQNAAAEDFNVRLVNDANHMLHVVGGLTIDGPVIKPFGSFRIDHPLDPENKYLYHSFVESPDMKNIYDGVARVDEKGQATVDLPEWFEALNQDFRYQLTAIGKPSPSLYIAEEIEGNRFKIGGGTPGTKVSWQVTGIRHDAAANAHRIRVEEDKPAAERGKLAYPIDQQNRTN